MRARAAEMLSAAGRATETQMFASETARCTSGDTALLRQIIQQAQRGLSQAREHH